MRQNEPQLSLWAAEASVKQGGTIVLIADDPDGEINHWIFGVHGKYTAASLWSGKPRSFNKAARLIIYGMSRDKILENSFGEGSATWFKSWGEVIEALKTHHNGSQRVAVLPDATSGIPEATVHPSV